MLTHDRTAGMTLVEILVVMAIIALLIIASIALFNPKRQIEKTWDAQRKHDLGVVRKILEDWYNDKNAYPKPSQICYNTASDSRIDIFGKTACTCNICGKKVSQSFLVPYLNTVPCDPQYPNKDYLYDYDCSGSGDNPQWFRIYTKLSNTFDTIIAQLGCTYGCGPSPNMEYNYLVYSPGIAPESSNCVLLDRLYQKDNNNPNICNICRSPSGGDSCNYTKSVYRDINCTYLCGPQ